MTKIISYLRAEPVALLYVVQSGLLLSLAFGLELTEEQLAAVLTFSGAVLSLIARQAVTPNQRVAVTVAEADSWYDPFYGIQSDEQEPEETIKYKI